MPGSTCPRRVGEFGPWEREEGLDDWDSPGGMIGQEQVGPSCSFCGSLHPDRFMELIREGWLVGPTDKNYKAYLAQPLTEEQQTARKTRWMETDGIARAVREVGERDGKSREQIQADLEQEWTERWAELLNRGEERAKFYFQHLSHEQRDEFIRLYNERVMKMSYPGHFYVMPFFCVAGAA